MDRGGPSCEKAPPMGYKPSLENGVSLRMLVLLIKALLNGKQQHQLSNCLRTLVGNPKSHEILMFVILQKDAKQCCDVTKLDYINFQCSV